MTAPVGLIQGRHALPVTEYLLTGPEVPFERAHVLAYQAAHAYCLRHGLVRRDPGTVDLYATGLTRALLGALAGFYDYGVAVQVVEYNATTGSYESVVAIGPCGFLLTDVSPETSFDEDEVNNFNP